MKWAYIGFAIVMETLGDYLIKKWSLTGLKSQAITGAALYAIGTIGWAALLKEETLQRAICLFAASNVVIVVALGAFVFGEQLRLRDGIATAMAIGAILMAEWPG